VVDLTGRAAACREMVPSEDMDSATSHGDGRLVRLHSRTIDTASLIRRLSRRRDVLYAEPNYLVRIARVPNDPYFWSLWGGLENTGQTVNQRQGTAGSDIHAPQAREITTGSDNCVVGVMDTGIDYRHPDLAGNVWTAPWSFPGSTSSARPPWRWSPVARRAGTCWCRPPRATAAT
jgi:subtilisin family serine protease